MEHVYYQSVLSVSEDFKLTDLYDDNFKPCQDPMLIIYKGKGKKRTEEAWDNSNYIYTLLESLKSKSKTDQWKDFKDLCKERKWNFKEKRKELLGMYKISKKLNMWESTKPNK